VKTTDEIYEELLTSFAERAGYTPEDSCDLSVRLYALAAQIQALFIQADWVLDQSFPQTAQGEYLDCHASLRGLSRIAAAKASGTLRFTVETAPAAALMVEAGTVCMTADEVRFETTENTTLAAGSLYADAPAAAKESGVTGNVSAGSIRILTACPVGITGCTNPTAFSGGADGEDDETLRARILESYQRLPNGANAAFYEQEAMKHIGVAAASAVGRPRGIGTVDVYVTEAAGLPDTSLLEEIREDLQEKREIAVDLQVKAPDIAVVDVSIEIAVEDGLAFDTVRDAAEAAVRSYFSGRLLGKPVRLAELGNRIYSVSGVENYHLLTPTGDLSACSTVLPVLGTLQITEIGED